MLLGGEIDAEIGLAGLDASEVRTVIPDAATVAADWSRRTGVRPINHVVAIKTTLLQAHPWLARELYALFVKARTGAPPAYGMAANRAAIETLLRFTAEQNLTPSRLRPEDIFAADLMAT
jgi:4,5-dihydroxyphthalate decarboxylase